MISKHRFHHRFLTAFIVCGMFGFASPLQALDWDSAGSRDVTFFYPGSASWEKILVKETHGGATKVRQKNTCLSCHAGEQAAMGKRIASDSQHVFYRATSGPASVQGNLKIAIEGGAIHFRVSLPGVSSGQLSMLLDDDAYPHSSLSSCWSSCHDDNRGMDSAGSMNLTKYLPASRSKNTITGGGESYRPASELQQLLDNGQFFELLGATFSENGAKALHGYVLEARHMDDSGLVSVDREMQEKATQLTLSRKLQPDTATSKAIVANGSYTLGLALHLNADEGPEHRVTMGVRFVTDPQNNIQFEAE